MAHRVHVDITKLHALNQGRGVGMYTELLVRSMKKYVEEHDMNWEIEIIDRPTKQRPEIVHYPYFDLFFSTLPLQLPTQSQKTVVTIHDVIPLVYPKFYKPGLRGCLVHLWQKAKLSRVDAILTDSDASRKDIHALLKLPYPKIHRVYLAGHPEIRTQPQSMISEVIKKYSLPKQYILYIGDINYNKNLPRLIEAYAKLNAPPALVLLGRSVKNTSIPEGRAIAEAVRKYKVQDRVVLLDSVPKEPITDIAAILSGAELYVQPSLYEGFGLPVLDAFQTNTIVCSSTGGSLSEVAGKAAVTFSPTQVSQIVRAMNRALSFSSADRMLYQRMMKDQIARFSWNKAAEETLRVYASLVRGR